MFDPWLASRAYAEAVTTARAHPPAWPQARAQHLQELVGAVRKRSPWWRERLAAAAAAAPDVAAMLQATPISRKHELMHDFDRWVTDPALRLSALHEFAHRHVQDGAALGDRYLVWESSGSSGEPALFVQDAPAMAVADALECARGPATLLPDAPWAGLWSGFWGGFGAGASMWAQRFGFVGAIDGPFASVVSVRRLQRLNPWAKTATRAFSFLQPRDALLRELDAWKPTVLMTYPSMARVLAEAQRRGRLHLRLAAVWLGGETLTAAMRESIRSAFGCAVRSSYGASECLNIASECLEGALHLNADWVILEPVDAHGRPVEAGRFGATTLLTHLANVVQPIVRYDLGDRVRLVRGACRCGSSLPMIEVEGRCADVLQLPDRAHQPVLLSPLALATVIEEGGGVYDFRLRQTGPAALTLQVHDETDAGAAGARALGALRAFLRDQGVAEPVLRLDCLPHACERGRSGKLARITADARCAPPRRPSARHRS